MFCLCNNPVDGVTLRVRLLLHIPCRDFGRPGNGGLPTNSVLVNCSKLVITPSKGLLWGVKDCNNPVEGVITGGQRL